MSNITLSALVGSNEGFSTKVLTNGGQIDALFGSGSAQLVDAGDLVAGTLKTTHDVTGAGILLVAAVQRNESTTTDVRGRLTIDGVVVSDLTSNFVSGSTAGTVNVGLVSGNAVSLPDYIPIRFNASFKYEVESSVGRTAGSSLKTYVKYYLDN